MKNQLENIMRMWAATTASTVLIVACSTPAPSGRDQQTLDQVQQIPAATSRGAAGQESNEPKLQEIEDGALASDVRNILKKHSIGAAAIGVMRGGQLVNEIYFGEEQPGSQADRNTQFEIASITKTVIAETTLRLVEKGLLELDEPLFPYWVDPDLVDDPRHRELTPRLVLSHRTGFPNWRFFRKDGRLVFERDPGTQFGYSGEGFNYLGRAIANKLGKPFPQIVDEFVFDPLSMESASIRNDPQFTRNFALLRTADGEVFEKHCRPGFCFERDGWSGAGLMTVTLRDFARFLKAVGASDGYQSEISAERDRVQTIKTGDLLVNCETSAPTPCPDEQGYGLGFEVARTGDGVIIGHGGFDYSTVSNAYIEPETGDGIIVFLTGPSRFGLPAMSELQNRLDPTSPYAAQYRDWAEQARLRNK